MFVRARSRRLRSVPAVWNDVTRSIAKLLSQRASVTNGNAPSVYSLTGSETSPSSRFFQNSREPTQVSSSVATE